MDNFDAAADKPSRSARKRDAKEIEHLVVMLVDLHEAQFSRLPLSEALRDELAAARTTKGRGARKRQLKYAAGLLRKDDDLATQLRAFIAGEHQSQYERARQQHQLERLREQLCAAASRSAAVAQVRQRYPVADIAALQRLLAAYGGAEDKKNYRLIFRWLRNAAEDESNSA